MVSLTNPFADPILYTVREHQRPLSPFINRLDRETRVVDAVFRVLKMRLEVCPSLAPMYSRALHLIYDKDIFSDVDLSNSGDMLRGAACLMALFNEYLAASIGGIGMTQSLAPYRLDLGIEDDVVVDLFSQSGGNNCPCLSVPVYSATVLAECKVVNELIEFGRE